MQRWRTKPEGEDARRGPRTAPKQKLSNKERAELLAVVNSPACRDLVPAQIVARLADEGRYGASESTMYRVLRAEGQLAHREHSAPRKHLAPDELVADGPGQIWSWDITYLPSSVRGRFFYLYLFVDVWSRRIMKAEVHDHESGDIAARMLSDACREHGVDRDVLVLHSDNGAPMKAATMLATMRELGVISSFSRPRVSDDNPLLRGPVPHAQVRAVLPAQALRVRRCGLGPGRALRLLVQQRAPPQRYRICHAIRATPRR